MAAAMHNPRRLLLLGCALKPEAVEGRYKTNNLYFVLNLHVHILDTNAFMIFE